MMQAGDFSPALAYSKVAQKLHKLIYRIIWKIRKTLENSVFSRVLSGDSSGIRTLDSLIKSHENSNLIILKTL